MTREEAVEQEVAEIQRRLASLPDSQDWLSKVA